MEQTIDNNNIIAPAGPILEVQEAVTSNTADNDTQTRADEEIEEIDSVPTVAKPNKPISRMAATKDEPIPNPLLDDPYEWELCTITVTYAVLSDQTVSVSMHNHKDEPIVKSFLATEVPLPEKISGVMGTLRAIWPGSTVSATIVLMPKTPALTERNLVISVRAGNDTPIVLTAVESDLPFPIQINTMLDELKALLRSRALKRIEKDAKTKISSATQPAAKAVSKSTIKPTTVVPTTSDKSQLTLF